MLDRAERKLEEGLVPFKLLADPLVFELENKRLWKRAWSFLGHESEIAKPGDYVVRNIGPYDSVIVIRSEDGKVRAFYNICAHRGMRVCRAEIGNTSHFRCPYHGWTYNNAGRLVGVPHMHTVYGDHPILEKYSEGLKHIRVESYNGFIFGNLNDKATPLTDFLGDFKWYLDILTKRTPAGLVFFPPLRHVTSFNWKIAAENFATDSYHFSTLHRFLSATGLMPERKTPVGTQAVINGHSFRCLLADSDNPSVPMMYPTYWPELVDISKMNLDQDQFQIFKLATVIDGNIFPNLSYLNTSQGRATFLTFRAWKPLAPDKTEFCAWFCVESEAPEEFKRKSYDEYTQQHSLAGPVEADDIEVWKHITANSKSLGAENMDMNFDVGIHLRSKPLGWKGPGKAAAQPNEMAGLEFWKTLVRYLRD